MDRLKVKEQLLKVLGNAPATLILGAPGIGKRFVVCEVLASQYPEQAERIWKGDHPDVMEMSGRELRVEQARELKGLTYRRPAVLENRFVLVKHADQLNVTCAALMLKTMEDCPPKTRWLLTAHRKDRLLPTIKSRSFGLSLSPLTIEEVEKIVSGLPRPAERAKWAEGNIGWAQSVDVDEVEEWDKWWSRMYSGQLRTPDLAKGLMKVGDDDYDLSVAVKVGTQRMALAIRNDPIKWQVAHSHMVQLVRDLEAQRAPRWWVQAWMVMAFRSVRGKEKRSYKKISRDATVESSQ